MTIFGFGFGADPGSVMFDQIGADAPKDWADTSIKVQVPKNLSKETKMVSVNPTKGDKIVGVDATFEVS